MSDAIRSAILEAHQRESRLRAAAPDLLEACEYWLGAVQNSLSLRTALAALPENAGPRLVNMLVVAIDKAHGTETD